MKRVVVFYSLSGNTRAAAQEAARLLQADLVELETIRKVPHNGFMRFMTCGFQAMIHLGAKLKKEYQFQPYDQIILGTPVWADQCVPAVNTILKNHDTAEKVIGVFTSSGGGDNDKCIKRLKKILPDLTYTAALADPRNQLSSGNDEKIQEFVEKINRSSGKEK